MGQKRPWPLGNLQPARKPRGHLHLLSRLFVTILGGPHPLPRGSFSLAELTELSGNGHRGWFCSLPARRTHSGLFQNPHDVTVPPAHEETESSCRRGNSRHLYPEALFKENTPAWHSAGARTVVAAASRAGPCTPAPRSAGPCPLPASRLPLGPRRPPPTRQRLWPPASFVLGIKRQWWPKGSAC